MKVFISWSGQLSLKIAQILRDWLPSVIQALEPYVSSEDIDKGARWSSDISRELEASCFGILCVTPGNVNAPWLNFEAGALSKSVEKSRVSPLLFGVKRSEIQGPLLQFQSTISEKDDVKKLLHSINDSVDPPCLDQARLDGILDVWWPRLQEQLAELSSSLPQEETDEGVTRTASRSEQVNEVLEEVLDLLRRQHKLLNSPKSLLPPDYLEFVSRKLREVPISPRAIANLERASSRGQELVREVAGLGPLTGWDSPEVHQYLAEIRAVFEEVDGISRYLRGVFGL